MTKRIGLLWLAVGFTVGLAGCFSDREGIARATAAETTVKYDFFHKPLPEIPVPNDLATRPDDSSPTVRR